MAKRWHLAILDCRASPTGRGSRSVHQDSSQKLGKVYHSLSCFPLEIHPRAAITVSAWVPNLSQVHVCGAHSSWESRDHPVQPDPHISPRLQGMGAARSDFSSYLLDGFKVRKEKISVIVGHLVLQHRDQPLQAHPSINTLLRKGFQCPISFPAQES